MLQKVGPHNISKGKRVTLAKDLPVHPSFGNAILIKEGTWGDVMSNGFENGFLTVQFYSHFAGTQNVRLDGTRANEYLLVDVMI